MTKFKPLACGYHSHTDYSLDGGSSIENKILHASEIGRIADCVTDHGIISGLMPHWVISNKLYKDKKIPSPIKSIHGIEAYVVDEDRPGKKFKNGKTESLYYHLTIHFKTTEAYLYFCNLSPIMEERAIVKYGERKPLLYLKELEPIAGQIVIGSGCLAGMVMANALKGRKDLARQNYIKLRNLAGQGNFFAEIMPHCNNKQWVKPKKEEGRIVSPGRFVDITPSLIRRYDDAIDQEPCCAHGENGIDIQKAPNMLVLELASEFKDPVVMSLDDHYAKKEDRIVQEMRMSNSQESWKFYNSYHQMTSEEAAEVFKQQLGSSDYDIETWIDNSYRFVDLFKDYKMITSKERWLPPSVESVCGVTNKTSKELLFDAIERHGRMPSKDDAKYREYKERLDSEVAVLADNGKIDWLPYILLLEDLSEFCKKNRILCNVRGSSGGSLIIYLLEISITDPIKYNLPFERFITLDRIKENTPPDADFDVEDREPVLAYLKQKYGDSFCLIANDLTLKLKGSILDSERAFDGVVSPSTAAMTKSIPPPPQGVSDKNWLWGYVDKETGVAVPGFWESKEAESLRKWAEKNPEKWETVKKAIGIIKTRGIHAGGVIITPDSAQKFIPVFKSGDDIVSSYNMKFSEEGGCIKYDILGVKTLKAMSITIREIEKDTGKRLKWEEFPHDDNVYSNIINKGKLSGLFQISTTTMRPFVGKIKPKSIFDLSATVAIVRPGSLAAPSPDPNLPDVTAANYFIGVRNGTYKPYYIHKDVEHIFEETGSICLYQEQLLQVFRDVAGYTYGQAEAVRRAVGKKIKELMEEHLGVLRRRGLEKGWGEDQADLLVKTLIKSASYSFNKAHSASYGIMAYNGAWLKYHYPLHFWKGELTVNNDDHDVIREYLNECGHLMLPISFEKSHQNEWLIEGDKLRPPLSLLRGCGEKTMELLKKFWETPIDELGVIVRKTADKGEDNEDME